MKHSKTFYSNTVNTPKGPVIVEGPILPEDLEKMIFHEDLASFRPALKQHQAILGISKLPEGRIIVCRQEQLVVGYTTFVYPDPLERWSEGNMENLIELGAIEVIDDFRGGGLGKEMLRLSMLDDAMEDYIVITTEYYWHWDLKRTGLNVWEYRKVMEKMMMNGGLEYFTTDDPEITSHPANCLMARIGSRVDQQSIDQFDRLRFANRIMY